MLHVTALAHLFGGQYGRAWNLCNGVPILMTQHSLWRVTEGSCHADLLTPEIHWACSKCQILLQRPDSFATLTSMAQAL